MYWDPNYPRILTIDQIEDLHKKRKFRLLGVADLSCDIEGSIEALKSNSSIDHPFFVYDINNRQIQWDVAKTKGIMFLAVDNLPTGNKNKKKNYFKLFSTFFLILIFFHLFFSEIPKDATQYFGDALLPFIEPLAFSDGSVSFEEQLDIPNALRSAVVTSHGSLTPAFEYIKELRKKTEQKYKDYRKVVVLGSGKIKYKE